MGFTTRYTPEPIFEQLGPEFADAVFPATFPAPRLRFWNNRAAISVGLGELSAEERHTHFARFEPLPRNQLRPLAMRYHGHQFRVYNPDLGDGRGFLLAQQRELGSGCLLDFGTKGSGRTPWSRAGDGRLTLKGGVREVLATAMLEALGTPTSRTFALFETGEALERSDEPSPTRGAALTRLSHSHIRFGSFQRLASLHRPDLVGRLVDHVVENYYTELIDAEDRLATLFDAIVVKIATMTARMMASGFVHGVLNTDNMNINGESFDYGPYRFLPRNDPNFVAAYFDRSGLYSFGRQPEAMLWNLRQLASALSAAGSRETLFSAVGGFSNAYRNALTQAMLKRLGVEPIGKVEDVALVSAAFRSLAEGGERLRWEPFFFDWFGGKASESRAMNGVRADLYSGEAFKLFRSCLERRAPAPGVNLASDYFCRSEPEELLFDEIERIWAAIAARDDWDPLTKKLASIDITRQAWGYDANNNIPQG